jgi:hypothetical protein
MLHICRVRSRLVRLVCSDYIVVRVSVIDVICRVVVISIVDTHWRFGLRRGGDRTEIFGMQNWEWIHQCGHLVKETLVLGINARNVNESLSFLHVSRFLGAYKMKPKP